MQSAPAVVASQASLSTARKAATSAEPAQPMAVTLAISGSPLAMVASRVPSETKSLAPVSPITCAALGERVNAAQRRRPCRRAQQIPPG